MNNGSEEIYNYIKERVTQVLGFGNTEISQNSLLEKEVGLSSIDMVKLYYDIEDKYNIKIPDEFLINDRVEDIVNVVVDIQHSKERYEKRIEEARNKLFKEG